MNEKCTFTGLILLSLYLCLWNLALDHHLQEVDSTLVQHRTVSINLLMWLTWGQTMMSFIGVGTNSIQFHYWHCFTGPVWSTHRVVCTALVLQPLDGVIKIIQTLHWKHVKFQKFKQEADERKNLWKERQKCWCCNGGREWRSTHTRDKV